MKKKLGKGGEYVDLYPADGYDPTEWERACITVDTCICRIQSGEFQVLLSKRDKEPFVGHWGFPGGFVRIAKGESLEEASYRTLRQKAGVTDIPIRQLAVYGDAQRDPRWRIMTVVFYALVSSEIIDDDVIRGLEEDKSELEHAWVPVNTSLPLAFDHKIILSQLRQRLKEMIRRNSIAFELVSPQFTWAQLQRVYEAILETPLTAGNFRRDIQRIYNVRKLEKKEPGKGRGKGRTGTLLEYVGVKSSFLPTKE
ncbi:MAG: NUDIX hydrolase [bacterium]|nr:NUDIX hydrolase [bacterium]